MNLKSLREAVLQANIDLVPNGLVTLTWGNASAVDRERGVMAIKPSGVGYADLKPEQIVLISLEDGRKVEGDLNPSSDTPTHLFLYQQFKNIGGIVHTHSTHATSWAQAGRGLPCFGTTHADHFYGEVPVTRTLTPDEIRGDYELNTGVVIVEALRDARRDPLEMPAVLVKGHAPFTWGKTVEKALENSIALEAAAKMALDTLALRRAAPPLAQELLDRHFLRKHGAKAYYGQGDKG